MIESSMRPDRVLLSRAPIAAIGGAYLLMGLVVSSYGPLLEHLTRRFAVSLPVAGATISVHFAASLVGVVIAMRTMTRLPARTTVPRSRGLPRTRPIRLVHRMRCARAAMLPEAALGRINMTGRFTLVNPEVLCPTSG